MTDAEWDDMRAKAVQERAEKKAQQDREIAEMNAL